MPDPHMTEKDEIDRVFPDRSAGRWCMRCEQFGTHYTGQHDHFLAAAAASSSTAVNSTEENADA